MSHLLAGVPKDVLGGKVLLAVYLEPLLLAELSQQSVIPAWISRLYLLAKLAQDLVKVLTQVTPIAWVLLGREGGGGGGSGGLDDGRMRDGALVIMVTSINACLLYLFAIAC